MPPVTRRSCKKRTFGLIQEEIQNNLYHLLVQAILWNQTRGKQARPILNKIIQLYPSPTELANANEEELEKILFPIGLYSQRAKRLRLMAMKWVESPPSPTKTFKPRQSKYPLQTNGNGWEIAHLPGIGPYALDSFRIFYRDQLLGKSNGWDSKEPEWQCVVPQDKDLRAFLRWAWKLKGYEWDPLTGNKVKSGE